MSRTITLSAETACLLDERIARDGFTDADSAISAALQDTADLAPWMVDEIDAALAEARANPDSRTAADQVRAQMRAFMAARAPGKP
jgi:Arc/MetJ-type ribon-helix-helix transcriptional regulator